MENGVLRRRGKQGDAPGALVDVVDERPDEPAQDRDERSVCRQNVRPDRKQRVLRTRGAERRPGTDGQVSLAERGRTKLEAFRSSFRLALSIH